MKVFILAGGKATRFNNGKPGPLKTILKIGKKTILEHILQIFGNNKKYQFYLLSGYKHKKLSLFCKNFSSFNKIKIQTIYSGQNTQTGGRIKKIASHLKDDEQFFMTYGDGLSDVNLNKLLEFHNKQKKLATITAVRPLARFGALEINEDKVSSFKEKPVSEAGWINGGVFVLSKKTIKYIDNFLEPFETGALPRLAAKKELSAFKHEGFWQPMDTLREKLLLNDLWETGKAPWQVNKRKIEKIIPFKKAKVS